MNRKRSLLFLFLLLLLPACESSPVSPAGGGSIVFRYSLAEQTHVKLRFENGFNTSMGTFVDSLQPSGEHGVVVPTGDWPPGIYFYILEKTPGSGGGTITTETNMLILKR